MSRDEPTVEVRLMRIESARDLPPPARATSQSAGFDLRARVDGALELEPSRRALVPTGVVIALPEGYEGQIRPRSGLALKHGLTLVNSPGTVDSDYRGEVGVLMVNLGSETVSIHRGDRIAQLVVQRLPRVEFVEAEELSATSRGAGGFGHTGKR